MQELMEDKKARINLGLFSSEALMSGGGVSRSVTGEEEEGAEELYRYGGLEN